VVDGTCDFSKDLPLLKEFLEAAEKSGIRVVAMFYGDIKC
jgi:hypothetical protein